MSLTERNILILKIIIEQFLETWEVMWSKLLLSKYDLWVSPATIRWDMAKLEKMHLIFQPYHSAWRLPTSKGIRAYVDYIMKETPSYFLNEENIDLKDNIQNFSDYVYNITKSLSDTTWEITFFSIPSKHMLSYSWIYHFIDKNKNKDIEDSLKIINMIEDKVRFMDFLKNLTLKDGINLFIWDENFLKDLKKYSIIIKPLIINNELAYIWIIWNLQQNYSFNIAAIKWII